MHSANPIVEFRNATLGYGRVAVLSGITFSIHEGEYFGLVGPNGAGKTTLLRAILGTLRPLAGEVVVSPSRWGYVPQREALDLVLPFTVDEIVMMGRYREIGLLHRPRGADREIVLKCLRHVDIENLATVRFNELSGGQKQRVLIARALASRPQVLLLDEPTNGMDLSSRTSILQLISSLHSKDKLTVVMVSHMLDDVANDVGRIALVEKSFFQVGDVDDVLSAENLSSVYQMSVRVDRINGRKIILLGEDNGNR